MAQKRKHKLIEYGNKGKAEILAEKLSFAVSIILIVISLFIDNETTKDFLCMISVVLAAYPGVEDMFEGFSKKKIRESVIQVVAVCAAMIADQFAEAAVIAILFRAVVWLRAVARGIAVRDIKNLNDSVSETAHLILETGGTESIDSDAIEKGMNLRILPRETVPADCIITEGKSTIEIISADGKTAPKIIGVGDRLRAGMVNGSATISVETVSDASDSGNKKIIDAAKETIGQKTVFEEKVSPLMKYVTAAIAVAAVAAGVIGSLVTGYAGTWIRNAIVILTSASALSVMALIPAPFLRSAGAEAKKGTVLRNVKSIEKMSGADTIVFDNPGMLASEKLKAGNVFAVPGYSEEDILALASAYAGETDDDSLKEIFASDSAALTEPDKKIICGDKDTMTENGIDVSSLPASSLYVSSDGAAVGCVQIVKETDEKTKEFIGSLRALRIKDIVVLSAENDSPDSFREAGIDRVIPNAADKNSALENIRSGEHKIIYLSNNTDLPEKADVKAFVGEEIPESADVAVTSDGASGLVSALKISRKAVNTVRINTAILFLAKIACIVLAFLSLAPTYISVLSELIAVVICMIISSSIGKVRKLHHSK